MSDDFNIVIEEEDLSVVVEHGDEFQIVRNSTTIENIGEIGNVDTTNTVNGSLLIYNTTTSKWEATTIVDGGEY